MSERVWIEEKRLQMSEIRSGMHTKSPQNKFLSLMTQILTHRSLFPLSDFYPIF